MPAGRSRFAFGLSAENNRLVEGVEPVVWLAKDARGEGPVAASEIQAALRPLL